MDRQQPKLSEQLSAHDRTRQHESGQCWQLDEREAPLEMQLCYEQMLNCLNVRLNQCITSFLAVGIDIAEADPSAPAYLIVKEQIFQILMTELQSLVRDWPIAIAFPAFNPQNQVNGSSSDQVNGFEGTSSHRDLWQLSSTQTNIIQLITEQTLEALQEQTSTRTWPIQTEQTCIAWLFIGSHLADDFQVETYSGLESDPPSQPSFNLSSSLTAVIDQSVQCCGQAIHQLELIQGQRQQYQRVIARNRELETTNQFKSQFLANTSHEIRTPLSSILGFTHLLLQQGYNPMNLRHQEYLKIILTSGQHLLALINDILDLSKIEANQLTLQCEELEVSEICKVAMTLVREKASDKGLDLRFEVAPIVSKVKADGLRLKQMLFNLLSNAVKFTVRGAVGLQVTVVEDYVRFTVWDTGTGISQEQQALLFKPYSQVANTVVPWGEGTGLGLVLTQKLAELHGGWIELVSEINQGSSFTIVLPNLVAPPDPSSMMEQSNLSLEEDVAELDEDQMTTGFKVQESQLDAFSTKPLLDQDLQSVCVGMGIDAGVRPNGILLVEDNYYNAKLLLTYLTHLGYEVTWAKGDADMWHALERSLPAVILMDIHLPGTDGITLIQQLKQDDRYLKIPIIAQTAMAMKGDRDRCLESGAQAYISKPIDLKVLAQLVFQHVNCCVE